MGLVTNKIESIDESSRSLQSDSWQVQMERVRQFLVMEFAGEVLGRLGQLRCWP